MHAPTVQFLQASGCGSHRKGGSRNPMQQRLRRRRPHTRPGRQRATDRGDWLAGRGVLPIGLGAGSGPYAERPEYYLPRGVLERPGPAGSGWPHPVAVISREAQERYQRALEDRRIARAVDAAIFRVLGPAADALAIYACDGEVAVAGCVAVPEAAHRALSAAWEVPGVRQVHDCVEIATGHAC
jgi:hypothetical protein